MHKVWVITVVVHVGAMKIYVAVVEVIRKKERRGENWMKLSLALAMVISEFEPPLKANVLFSRLKKKTHLVLGQTQGTGALFS
jgi:hypothetical protein